MLFQKLFRKLLNLNNWFLFFASIILIGASTVLMKLLEPKTFPFLFDSFWWVMTTVTTVGYGDFYPVTVAGRIYAIFLYFFGIGLIGVVIGKLVESLSFFRLLKEEGKMQYLGVNHIVMIGWSGKVQHAIAELLDSDSRIEIVLIASLEKTPVNNERIHYIQGEPADEEILQKANVKKCRSIIIFVDETIKEPKLADAKSLMAATAISKYAGDLHITVEVLEEKHIELFRHVSVDEFVVSDETISHLAVQAALSAGASKLFSQMLSRSVGDDVCQIPIRPEWKTYRDAFTYLAEQGATLIGDKESLNIASKLDEALPEKGELFVICNDECYEHLVKNNSRR
ncbi:ion transporter [Bacillus sp. M6-12]|nr:ion transporter [Bacillus sp. M6-12]